MKQIESEKSLSQRPVGYLLAILGGTLGGPIGWVASPVVLLILNNIMKEKENKHPNRFLIWAAIGIIGAPISLIPIFSGANTTTTNKQAETEMVAEAEKKAPEITAKTGVNKENYLKIQNGMSYAEVIGILGENGEELSSNEISGIKTEMYIWKAKGFSGGNMNAMFQNGALISKAQFNLN